MEIALVDDEVRVKGHFQTDSGSLAGHFVCFMREDEGALQIEQNDLLIFTPWRAYGFGGAWYKECERRYRSFGITRVTLCAAGEHGGYFWAREGFVFLSEKTCNDFWQRAQHVLTALKEAEYISEGQAGRWRRLAEQGELDKPQKILRLGYRQIWRYGQHRMWPGKRLLLGSLWEGEKTL